MTMRDDLDRAVDVPPEPAERVVSLVPSLTEALASVRADALVGITDWCTHPADLDARGVERVRGTKNPDTARIAALRPALVVANKEENRELDVRRLGDAGVAVWVTDIETVPEAIASMGRLLDALRWEHPAWLAQARAEWDRPPPRLRAQAVMPIWRDPWMVVGPSTFTADLLRRCGVELVGGDPGQGRYPRAEVADLDACGADLVLLPDEPYVFTSDDGPEAFEHTPTRLVSGRVLTWYGPSLADARAEVEAALDA